MKGGSQLLHHTEHELKKGEQFVEQTVQDEFHQVANLAHKGAKAVSGLAHSVTHEFHQAENTIENFAKTGGVALLLLVLGGGAAFLWFFGPSIGKAAAEAAPLLLV